MAAVVTTLVCTAWLLFVRRTPGWGHWSDTNESAPRLAAAEGEPAHDLEEREWKSASV